MNNQIVKSYFYY